MNEIIATGKTVEQATENGCAQLGRTRDEVSIEIIEMPIKKFFRTIPAKVKVTFIEDEPVEAPKKEIKQEEKRTEENTTKEIKKVPEKTENKENTKTLPSEPLQEINLVQNPHIENAIQYLLSIFNAMGADTIKIKAFSQGEATLFKIEGFNLVNIFDVQGDSVQALSYLVDRAVNKGVDKNAHEYIHVRLDIEGYRDKRESELTQLAKRVAKEVNRTHRSKTLPSMNAYERLIIHTAVGEIDGVVSESIGRDNDRRVVIKSNAPDATNGGEWRMNNRSGKSTGYAKRNSGKPYANNGARKSYAKSKSITPAREYANNTKTDMQQPIVPKTREVLNDGEDIPLYGKIEL